MSQGNNKRRKKYYGGNHDYKKYKFALTLKPGIKGFICTHNGHPKYCIREAYNILDDFRQPDSNKEEDVSSKNEVDDFESELKRDIEKVNKLSEDKEFQVVDTGVTGCVFIKSSIAEPREIVEKIIERILESGRSISRNIIRMLPIEVTCKAYLEDIKKAAADLFDVHFKGDVKTYAIVVNRRNNGNVLRDELIQALGLLIRDRNPSHSADLKKPQLTILVEILKAICCLAVIPDYNKHKKYNLVELGIDCQTQRQDQQITENTDNTTGNGQLDDKDTGNDNKDTDVDGEKTENGVKQTENKGKQNVIAETDVEVEISGKQNINAETDVKQEEHNDKQE